MSNLPGKLVSKSRVEFVGKLPPGSSARRGWLARLAHPAFLSLLLATATVAAFWPVVRCGFISYDDPIYVSDNPHVLGGLTVPNVLWSFHSFYGGNWHPLTWLSHMLDAEVFGTGPTGPHVINLALHVANVILLFFLLWRLTSALWRSLLVAALFALHPLHVESVAWIAERKDVLSTLFFMLSLIAYERYAKRESPKAHSRPVQGFSSRSLWYYLLALSLFALGLMGKPMLVTLPLLLLLLDYWPLRRFEGNNGAWRLLLEKVPFLVLSGASCFITLQAQKPAIQPTEVLPLSDRAINAIIAYGGYLGKLIWPMHLALPYLHAGNWPTSEVVMSFSLLVVLSLVAVVAVRGLPSAFVGWFWFCGTLVPVIGLVQVGQQSMADRYTYIPSIGLFIVLAWSIGAALTRWRLAISGVCAATACVLVFCGALTWRQAGYWQTNQRLFQHSAEVTKDNYVAFDNLGNSLVGEGRFEEAISFYRRSLSISPSDADARFNLGNALAGLGRYEEAVEAYQSALLLKPGNFMARNNLANKLIKLGRGDEAAEQFRLALRSAPDVTRIRVNLASLLWSQGHVQEAIENYRLALEQEPGDPRLRCSLGNALAFQENWDGAIEQYETALHLGFVNPNVHCDLGYAWMRSGRLDQAVTHIEAALRLKPSFPSALYFLGCIRADQGRFPEAAAALREALRLKPDYREAAKKLSDVEAQPERK
jgi:protein O-mannosyl-transferase